MSKSNLTEIPTEEIKAKLRQTLEPQLFGDVNITGSDSREEENEDIVLLKTSFDIYNIPITSYQKFMQPVIIGLRKLVRKLLKPVLERQVIYNFTNASVIQSLTNQIKELQAKQAQLESEIESLQKQLNQK